MTYSPNDPQERREDEAAAVVPTPQPTAARRNSLDSDEWIAILVAFGVIGTIFFWSIRPQANANGGGWLNGNGFGLLGGKDEAANLGLDGTAAIPSQTEAEAEANLETGAAGLAGEGGKLTSPSANLTGAIANPDKEATLPSRRNLTGAAAGLAAGAAIGTATAGEAAPAPAVPGAATTPTAATPEPAATAPAAAPPLQVAAEDLDTSVPTVDASSWVAPFAAALTQADRFGELPSESGAKGFDIDAPVTRAEFAALINQAEQAKGDAAAAAKEFADIETSFWAADGIAGARSAGFMSGYSTLTPDGKKALAFRPGEQIPRWQVFVTLASGLKLKAPADVNAALKGYDTTGIPDWAKPQVAATLQEGLVINPDSAKGLEPTRPATRGEATAMLQQVLERQGKVDKVDASKVTVKGQ